MGHQVTSDGLTLLAGAYIAWEKHIGQHYCLASTGEGNCDVGDEVLRRLHTAYTHITYEEAKEAMEAIRNWEWETMAPYEKGT